MKLKELNIISYRGIKNAKFDLQKVNVFTGSNGAGKTTCLDAINYLLTGETYVNGKNASRDLNQSNNNEACELALVVEFEFEGVLIEKTYSKKISEKYRKTRGEDTIRYDGIAEECYINGTKVPERDYKNDLKKTFGITFDTENNPSFKNINIFRLLTDFEYLDNLDPKFERPFLNYICNVPSDAILLNNEQFSNIKQDMFSNTFNAALLATKYRENIKSCNNDIELSKSIIENDNNKIKLLDFDNDKYEDLKLKNNDLVNDLNKKADEINKAKEILENSKANDLQGFIKANKELTEMKNSLISKQNELNVITSKISETRIEYSKELSKLNNMKSTAVYVKQLIENDIKALETINNNATIVVCEECKHENKIVNTTEIERLNAAIRERDEDLAKAKEEYKNINIKATEIEMGINTLEENKNAIIKELDKLKLEINTIESNVTEVKESETTTNAKNAYNDLVNAYNEKYAQYNEQKAVLDSINENRNTYIQISNAIKSNNDRLAIVKKELAINEIKQDELKEFVIFKNKAIQKASKDVFGDIEFILVEESKKDSDKEKSKCYAKIGGVEFGGVNTAKKTLVGIEIIECIRKQIGGAGLPIIFDICDNIGNTLMKQISEKTNAQIICTRANKEDGKELSLEHDA